MTASKPTILCLHGALGVAADLEALMGLLSEKGYRCLAFNFSGHGMRSAAPPEFRIDFFARELDKYIKEHGLENPAVFGHSMGGYVALYHKAHFSDSPIDHIITYGTKFNWSESSVQKELPMLDPAYLEKNFSAYAKLLAEKHGEGWKQLLRSTAHMIQNLEKLDGLTREDLCDLEIPVLMLLGDQDRMVTTEETQLTASWLNQAQVRIIAHSKHEIERANVREIADVISDSLI